LTPQRALPYQWLSIFYFRLISRRRALAPMEGKMRTFFSAFFWSFYFLLIARRRALGPIKNKMGTYFSALVNLGGFGWRMRRHWHETAAAR
jgi:hypothetical protein